MAYGFNFNGLGRIFSIILWRKLKTTSKRRKRMPKRSSMTVATNYQLRNQRNNMKYQIKWCEVKKEGFTNGKPWKITSMLLVDEQGNEHDKVDTFDPVMNGGEIEGEIVTDEKYHSKKFITKKAQAGANFKAQQIEKAVAHKEQSISKFQDNKDWSIMVSSTMRDAVLLTIAEMNNTPDERVNIGDRVKYWRKWLLDHWEVKQDDTQPF